MKKECAFCPETANLSLEHLWSDWMNELFPGKKRFTSKNEKGQITAQWEGERLDWKARVVCRQCNNGWMSQLEAKYAKPAMTDLILGKEVPLTQSCARSIALFAFKTAVIFDHVKRDREPFFRDSSRHRFSRSLTIPFGISMWIAGFLPMGKGEVHTAYHEGSISPTNPIRIYVCTYAVGHLVFQVVAARQRGFVPFSPRQGFESIAIPF
jgi:hypothetical protein